MPIPANVARISLTGTLIQGEQFDTSFWVAGGVPANQADANDLAEQVAAIPSLTTIGAGGPRTMLDVTSAYTEVRVYSYPTGGPSASFIGTAAIDPGTGVSAEASLPLQCCIVASLRTGFAGRSRRGRMYFPVTALSLVSHQMSEADLDAFAGVMKSIFDAVNAFTDPALVVSVVSQTLGDHSPVATVTADSRIDIQRRRAEGQTELHQSSVTLA